MTTIELEDIDYPARAVGPSRPLAGIVAALLYRHRQRQTLPLLSQLDTHLLLDIVIDTTDVRDARDGDQANLWRKAHLRPDFR